MFFSYRLWSPLCIPPSAAVAEDDNQQNMSLSFAPSWMDEFLHQCGLSPCGAFANYMVEKENAQGNKSLLLPVRRLWSSLLRQVPQNNAGVSLVLGVEGEEGRRASSVPP